MLINFLLNLLDLGSDPMAAMYYDWYANAGATIGVLIPLVTSLVFVLLFYYVWSKVKATTAFHWLIMGVLNLIVTFFLNLFMGSSFLANYVLSLDDPNLLFYVSTWPFPVDLWIFAVNGAIWAILFYFVLSCILKNWSSSYNIPFGKSHKKIKKA